MRNLHASVAATLISGASVASAQSLYFGDATNPAGDFELTSGSAAGANYYLDADNTSGNLPDAGIASRVYLGNNAIISNGVADAFSFPGVSLGTTANPTDPAIDYADAGTLNVTGGTFETTGGGGSSLLVGDATDGTLNLSGGGVTVGGRFALATGGGNIVPGTTGTVNVSGGTLQVNGGQGFRAGPRQVGNSAVVTLSGTGIINVPNGGFNLGDGPTAAGDNHVATVSGVALNIGISSGAGGILRVGQNGTNGGTNTFNFGSVTVLGTTAAGESLIVGAADDAGGDFNLTGGTRAILVGEGKTLDDDGTPVRYHHFSTFNNPPEEGAIGLEHLVNLDKFRHGDDLKFNYLFADGHAETLVWSETWQRTGRERSYVVRNGSDQVGCPTMWRQTYEDGSRIDYYKANEDEDTE